MTPLSTREFPFLKRIYLLLFLAALLPIPIARPSALDLLDFLPEELYRSSATIQLDFRDIDYLPEGGLAPEVTRRLESSLLQVQSRSLVEDIVKELRLHSDVVSEREMRDLVRRVRRGIEIREAAPNLYEFSVIYTDPMACQNIVNLLIRNFIKEMIESQDRAIMARMLFLEQELELYQKKAEETWERVRKFRIDNLEYISDLPPVPGPPDRTPDHPLLQRYRKHSEQLLDLESELKLLTAKQRRLEKKLEDTEQTAVSSREIDRKSGTVLTVTESVNPVYRELELELFRARERIASLEDKIELSRALGESRRERIKKLPDIMREYAGLSREYRENSRAVEKLLEEREQVFRERRIELEERGTRFLIFDSAEVPLEPYRGEEVVSLLPRPSARADNLLLRALVKFFFH